MHALGLHWLLLTACADRPTGSTPGSVDTVPPGTSSGDTADDGGMDDAPADTGTGDTGSGNPPDTGADGGLPERSPLAGLTLYVDPASRAARQAEAWRDPRPEDAALMDRIAAQPVAMWLGAWSGDVERTVRDRQEAARQAQAVATYVVYDIPNRDCGGYSGGGARDADAYRAWVDGVARGLGGAPSIVVLEPDALVLVDCLDAAGLEERWTLLREAAGVLAQAGAYVYVDLGHSAWLAPDVAAERLQALAPDRLAGVPGVTGFALNVSNFRSDRELLGWAEAVRARTGMRYVLDTSRNGLGPDDSDAWCNPPGRALGLPPDVDPPDVGLDARLWVKTPGESDGSCNGGPSAGTWWPEYALGLAERATWGSVAVAKPARERTVPFPR
jgi:endoglucanase